MKTGVFIEVLNGLSNVRPEDRRMDKRCDYGSNEEDPEKSVAGCDDPNDLEDWAAFLWQEILTDLWNTI